MFVRSCLYRLFWFWAWWPAEGGWWIKFAMGCWYGTWLTLAALGLKRLAGLGVSDGAARLYQAAWIPGLALLVTLTTVHCLYWSNMRMRTPLMPTVYLLGLAAAASRISPPPKQPSSSGKKSLSQNPSCSIG
jgi:hypothetical protein